MAFARLKKIVAGMSMGAAVGAVACAVATVFFPPVGIAAWLTWAIFVGAGAFSGTLGGAILPSAPVEVNEEVDEEVILPQTEVDHDPEVDPVKEDPDFEPALTKAEEIAATRKQLAGILNNFKFRAKECEKAEDIIFLKTTTLAEVDELAHSIGIETASISAYAAEIEAVAKLVIEQQSLQQVEAFRQFCLRELDALNGKKEGVVEETINLLRSKAAIAMMDLQYFLGKENAQAYVNAIQEEERRAISQVQEELEAIASQEVSEPIKNIIIEFDCFDPAQARIESKSEVFNPNQFEEKSEVSETTLGETLTADITAIKKQAEHTKKQILEACKRGDTEIPSKQIEVKPYYQQAIARVSKIQQEKLNPLLQQQAEVQKQIQGQKQFREMEIAIQSIINDFKKDVLKEIDSAENIKGRERVFFSPLGDAQRMDILKKHEKAAYDKIELLQSRNLDPSFDELLNKACADIVSTKEKLLTADDKMKKIVRDFPSKVGQIFSETKEIKVSSLTGAKEKIKEFNNQIKELKLLGKETNKALSSCVDKDSVGEFLLRKYSNIISGIQGEYESGQGGQIKTLNDKVISTSLSDVIKQFEVNCNQCALEIKSADFNSMGNLLESFKQLMTGLSKSIDAISEEFGSNKDTNKARATAKIIYTRYQEIIGEITQKKLVEGIVTNFSTAAAQILDEKGSGEDKVAKIFQKYIFNLEVFDKVRDFIDDKISKNIQSQIDLAFQQALREAEKQEENSQVSSSTRSYSDQDAMKKGRGQQFLLGQRTQSCRDAVRGESQPESDLLLIK